MGVNVGYLGRTFPATEPYEVSRVKIADFAEAIGDPNPLYTDAAAAKAAGYPDVIAPPTFPIVITMAASGAAIGDPGLGLNYAMVVHGEQRFTYVRPIRAGDALSVVVTVESVRSVAGNDIVSTKGDVSTVDGDPVLTTYSTLVVRGADS